MVKDVNTDSSDSSIYWWSHWHLISKARRKIPSVIYMDYPSHPPPSQESFESGQSLCLFVSFNRISLLCGITVDDNSVHSLSQLGFPRTRALLGIQPQGEQEWGGKGSDARKEEKEIQDGPSWSENIAVRILWRSHVETWLGTVFHW